MKNLFVHLSRIMLLLFTFGYHSLFSKGDEGIDTRPDYLNMTLEELMNLEVTSVSKKTERLRDVASSIYVVTAHDIEVSGATNLHEVLRNVPGYWGVQDEYNSVYATMRNSPTRSTDPQTILYLLDGTPLQEIMGQTFSFKNFDIPLDEIERIEVISGSGGTIYGANSATGVINIFTKDPEKYDGINTRVEGASPGYAMASLRAGGALNDKLAVSGYGKFRYFDGFVSLAGKDENGEDALNGGQSRFSENYDKSTYYSLGLKTNYRLGESSRFSTRIHYNGREKIDYTNSYDAASIFTGQDILHKNDVRASRIVANIRFDHTFNENHELFLRASTNLENDFNKLAGGFDVSNAIYDFEIQDNFSLGEFNAVSVGLNYRLVHFDIHNINDPNQLQYFDPQAKESLNGAFIQNKLSVLDRKLKIIGGVKAENYTLTNKKYYISPMLKVSYLPTESLTLWGGFTQSYTTQGFNNTNIDYLLVQKPSDELFATVATAQALQAANIDVNDQAAVNAFLASADGQNAISQFDAFLKQSIPLSQGIKNGDNTVPTRFQTWELGIKTGVGDILQFNTTFFYTKVTDGVAGASIAADPVIEQSRTRPNETVAYFLYGNYTEGENTGIESVAKFVVSENIFAELSYTWLSSKRRYNDNPVLNDVNNIDFGELNIFPSEQYQPEHIARFRFNANLGNGFNANLQTMYATKYQSEDYVFLDIERYLSLLETETSPNQNTGPRTLVAKNSNRFILNLRIEKNFSNDAFTVYAFGNDMTNDGRIEHTDELRNVTLSQIGAMYGAGLNYRLR